MSHPIDPPPRGCLVWSNDPVPKKMTDPIKRSASATIFAAALSVLLGGCATFQPVEPGQLAPGDEVRVYLTGQGRELLQTYGAGESRQVDGEILEANGDRLLLRVPTVRQLGGNGRRLYQRVWLETAHIADLEQRHPDRSRTAMVAGAAGAAAIFALVALAGGLSGSSGCPAIDSDPGPDC